MLESLFLTMPILSFRMHHSVKIMMKSERDNLYLIVSKDFDVPERTLVCVPIMKYNQFCTIRHSAREDENDIILCYTFIVKKYIILL